MFSWVRALLNQKTDESSGAWGEQQAALWLVRERGFRVVARNWRSPQDRRDELDLVARDGEVLVFIEVKTRRLSARVSGYHAINRRKRAVLRRACDAYLRSLSLADRPQTFRFDVVEVRGEGRGSDDVTIAHFQNVALFRHFYRR
ncbi:MAG TPA: YraN family protein [Opitutaceae bacterium]|nr:YraN family protein [Opitutaceae bacterium]